jgi:glutamate racemase
MSRKQTFIGVFDSGAGGLTIYRSIRTVLPDEAYFYCSDNEFHPYGTKPDEVIAKRTLDVCARFVERSRLDVLVVACNTASTVALDLLRANLTIPVVGVVPAIKPASVRSRTHTIGLLATPATIKRTYVDELIQSFASHCRVLRVGSSRLVELAEEKARGKAIDIDAVAQEIHPLFETKQDQPRNIDTVVLGCTHFPLLVQELTAAAPWPVEWIDSGDAVAARVKAILRDTASASGGSLLRPGEIEPDTCLVTSLDPFARSLAPVLRRFGFHSLRQL